MSEARETVDAIVDTGRYPLADPAAMPGLIARVRADLAGSGCCVLADFIRPELRETLRREGAELARQAYFDVETVNVYNTSPDPTLPAEHPAARPLRRGNAFVGRDRIPGHTVIQRLYTSTVFQRFVAAGFGLATVYELADPLAGLVLNVVEPGQGHPWHFDTNEFTVTLLTQRPEAGGTFEYCPGIRSAQEENLAAVRAVLDGVPDAGVRRLDTRPGDLQLFQGRYSLHRVCTVQGQTARHTAILAYSERPGVLGTVERTRQLFGRVTPEHLAAQRVRVDELLI